MPEILKKYSMSYYYVRWNAIFLITKANKMHNFSDLFDKVLDMFRTGPLSKTCRVLYQINLRNRASPWLLL